MKKTEFRCFFQGGKRLIQRDPETGEEAHITATRVLNTERSKRQAANEIRERFTVGVPSLAQLLKSDLDHELSHALADVNPKTGYQNPGRLAFWTSQTRFGFQYLPEREWWPGNPVRNEQAYLERVLRLTQAPSSLSDDDQKTLTKVKELLKGLS